jgi:hypothetical protein
MSLAATPRPSRGPAEAGPVPLALLRAQHHWPIKVFGRPLPRRWMRPSRMFRSAALLLADHCSWDSTGQPAPGALKAFMLLTEAPAGSFTQCPLNLNSHNHNQHAGRPCFSLAVPIERSTSTLRYDISRLRDRASHVSAHAIHAHAEGSSLHRSTTAEPSCACCKQSVRPATRMTVGRHSSAAALRSWLRAPPIRRRRHRHLLRTGRCRHCRIAGSPKGNFVPTQAHIECRSSVFECNREAEHVAVVLLAISVTTNTVAAPTIIGSSAVTGCLQEWATAQIQA